MIRMRRNQWKMARMPDVTVMMLVLAATLIFAACARDFSKPPQPPEPGVIEGSLEAGQPQAGPVSGARVRVLECGLSVLSESDGDFRVYGVPDGDYTVRMDMTMAGAEDDILYLTELEDSVLVRGPGVSNLGTITLDMAGSVEGTVLLPNGISALNTVIYVVGGDALTHANDKGEFSLAGIPPGSRSISAARPGYMLGNPVDVIIEAGSASTGIVLNLQPVEEGATGALSGTVLLGNPGPEAGVSVTLTERFRSLRYATRTGAAGEWNLSDIPVGFYELRSSHPGYRPVGLPNLEIRQEQEQSLPNLILPPEDADTPANPSDGDPNGNTDDDGDGIPDTQDNCPVIPNSKQLDSNADGIGDACSGSSLVVSGDRDFDGVPDELDNCPDDPNAEQANHDDDPLGDECDNDIDDDGLPNSPVQKDNCPYVPDPSNDATLCDWSLVYSDQDAQGAIHLFYYEMRPNAPAFEPQQLTVGEGQSWGAWVHNHESEPWVYFHHRPGTDPDENFRICRINIEQARLQPVSEPECFELGGSDCMHPHVCQSMPPVLFYEQFDEDRWNIYATALPGVGEQIEPGVLFDLASVVSPPALRPFSFRHPHCMPSAVATNVLAFSQDFGNGRGEVLDWDVFLVSFDPVGLVAWEPLGEFGGDGLNLGTHERRPCLGDYEGRPVWFFDHEDGLRIDIWFTEGVQATPQELIVDGSRNINPHYLPSKYGEESGLLAYQSEAHGSFDVYVMSLTSGWVHRVTEDDGWEGGPAWIRTP